MMVVVIVVMPVRVGVRVIVAVTMVVFVVGVLHAGRHGDVGRRLRIEHPPEQQHE